MYMNMTINQIVGVGCTDRIRMRMMFINNSACCGIFKCSNQLHIHIKLASVIQIHLFVCIFSYLDRNKTMSGDLESSRDALSIGCSCTVK